MKLPCQPGVFLLEQTGNFSQQAGLYRQHLLVNLEDWEGEQDGRNDEIDQDGREVQPAGCQRQYALTRQYQPEIQPGERNDGG